MAVDDKLIERKLLLKRVFPVTQLFKIGRDLKIPYFDCFRSGWEIDDDEASFEIAANTDNTLLPKIFEKNHPRRWSVFRGQYYTFENGAMTLEGSWNRIRANILQEKTKFGKNLTQILKGFAETGGSLGLKEIEQKPKRGFDICDVLTELEKSKVIVTSYMAGEYQEWKILEETLPLVQSELGLTVPTHKAPMATPRPREAPTVATPTQTEKEDYVQEERRKVELMDKELEEYLAKLTRLRLKTVVEFGETFSTAALVTYLQNLFGSILYYDSLLSIIQQYGLSDAEIVHPKGKTGMRTGWSLALFGEPGTGKSFSTRDMILGRPEAKIPPHGIPGRNRYCGGITPARFIRIGQAYTKRTFNFIVPEFNDWFRYSGMVDVLKLAMERGEIKYELHKEVIGPYRFDSFLSVNYNTAVFEEGYKVTITDPNFNAIEDRMMCRLHRLTKQRFIEIAQSQMRLALGEIDIDKDALNIRDHATLVYAIETRHPLVKDKFPYKPVMITPQTYDLIKKARDAILERIPREMIGFSARLEERAIRFACAASLLSYFNSNLDYIPVGDDALKYALQLYVEEASIRSHEVFKPREILEKLF